MKLPAIQFYPGDWRKDPGIQALDFETRGIWFEMLCLMSESAERGKLLLNGAAMPVSALAKVLGITDKALQAALDKLLSYGVAGRDETGIIFNRRMIRDEEERKRRKGFGKLGGNPALLNTPLKTPLKAPPTTALSSVEPLHEVATEDEVEESSGVRGAGERGCAVEEALAFAADVMPPITEACVRGWHEDRSRAQWHYPKSKSLFPLPPGKVAWQNDLRIFARNWKTCEDDRKAANGSTPTPNSKPPTETVWQIDKAIEAINEELRDIDASVTGAWGELSPGKKAKRAALVERRKELKSKLTGAGGSG